MKPLHFGKMARTHDKFDLMKKPSSMAAVVATITPKGPRLMLDPVLDRIIISDPDAGAEEQNMVEGIHLPATALGSFNAYAKVTVFAVAPGVKTVKAGDEVIVVKPQCQQFSYDGQAYFWTTEVAVMGIVRDQ